MAVLAGRLRRALTMAALLLELAPSVSGGLLDRKGDPSSSARKKARKTYRLTYHP
jgi:hypothetical protein